MTNWRVLTRDRWVLNTVQEYLIEFTSCPYQTNRPHPPQYSKAQNELIKSEILDMLQEETITKIREVQTGFHSNLFLVPKKDGG